MNAGREDILVCLGAGIGNVVLATPLLAALEEMGFATDLLLAADYPQTAALLEPWGAVQNIFTAGRYLPPPARYARVLPALPPFYHARYARYFDAFAGRMERPPDFLFYQNEQEFYLSFAQALGYPSGRRPFCILPISPAEFPRVTNQTLVLAPGCKTGVMAAKRWPHFAQLAEAFHDVAIVGTSDDLVRGDGSEFAFPGHVRSLVDQLTLRQTAEVLAGAGVVVANDSGLAHVAAAVGTRTIILFGPTPDRTLGTFPPNVTILRQGLPCEPCWFQDRFKACDSTMTCLQHLTLETVVRVINREGLPCATAGFPTRR